MNFFTITRKLLFTSLIVAVAQASAVTERTYAQKARNDFKACGVLTAATLAMDYAQPRLAELSEAKLTQAKKASNEYYQELGKKRFEVRSDGGYNNSFEASRLAKENSKFFNKNTNVDRFARYVKAYVPVRFGKVGLNEAGKIATFLAFTAAKNATTKYPKSIVACSAAGFGIKGLYDSYKARSQRQKQSAQEEQPEQQEAKQVDEEAYLPK